jgi:hypothetical protein
MISGFARLFAEKLRFSGVVFFSLRLGRPLARAAAPQDYV